MKKEKLYCILIRPIWDWKYGDYLFETMNDENINQTNLGLKVLKQKYKYLPPPQY